MTDRPPLIGLTLDIVTSPPDLPDPPVLPAPATYQLRRRYADAVTAAGGLPVALPYDVPAAGHYSRRLDGVLITGGAFDIDPALFGDAERHPTVTTKDERTAFECALTREALGGDIPLLGICGGMQLLAVVLGGTLLQHIPDQVPDALAHEQPNPRDEPGHAVIVKAPSRLASITGRRRLQVNSAHHQAVGRLPEGVTVNAVAPDGVIEGIERPGGSFCLGVQWHPEYHVDPADGRLLAAFIAACREAREAREARESHDGGRARDRRRSP